MYRHPALRQDGDRRRPKEPRERFLEDMRSGRLDLHSCSDVCTSCGLTRLWQVERIQECNALTEGFSVHIHVGCFARITNSLDLLTFLTYLNIHDALFNYS